jgi:predicted hydrocarbon binding protein
MMKKPKNRDDFEGIWQEKLAKAIEKRSGEDARNRILAGGEILNQESPTEDRIRWTCGVLGRLAEETDQEKRQEVLADCACRYPVDDLQDVKETYQANRDLDQAIAMLGEKFERFLRDDLGLEETLIFAITRQGWGLAGIHDPEQNRIIATKIPKSGYIKDYFEASDPEEKRRIYCHCPRVREGVGKEPQLPEEYCYCGAGFYKGIWEEILGEPVRVEVLESVMNGGDRCRIAVHLPEY